MYRVSTFTDPILITVATSTDAIICIEQEICLQTQENLGPIRSGIAEYNTTLTSLNSQVRTLELNLIVFTIFFKNMILVCLLNFGLRTLLF